MEELFQESAEVGEGYFAVTHARYDAETGALHVEQSATSVHDGSEALALAAPAPRQVVETVHGRSAAIRYVVALADSWIGVVQGSLASA